jgi:uroporphyrinogen-III synthase
VFLEKNKFNFDKAVLYHNESNDLKDLKLDTYEAIILFSPSGVKSLFENFPDYKQGDQKLGALGANTAQAFKEAGLRLDIAPTPESPSILAAIENYLKQK